MKSKQSAFGISSFILALLPFTYGVYVLFSGQNIVELIDQIGNETLRESLGWMVGMLLVLTLSIIPILSAYFGIIGLLQKNNKKSLAIAGLVLDAVAIIILGLVFFVL